MLLTLLSKEAVLCSQAGFPGICHQGACVCQRLGLRDMVVHSEGGLPNDEGALPHCFTPKAVREKGSRARQGS